MSLRDFGLGVWATEGLVIVESLDVRKDGWRGALGAALDGFDCFDCFDCLDCLDCPGCLCRYRGCLWLVEDGKLGNAPAARYTEAERLLGIGETGDELEMSRTGFSRIQAVYVQAGGSILRAQVSPCRRLKRMADSRWTIPIPPDSVTGIRQWNFESEDIVGQTTAGPAGRVAAFAGGRKCGRPVSFALDCSGCSLSSLTNASRRVFLVLTSYVLSQVSSAVAVRWEEEDTRRWWWNRARVVRSHLRSVSGKHYCHFRRAGFAIV